MCCVCAVKVNGLLFFSLIMKMSECLQMMMMKILCFEEKPEFNKFEKKIFTLYADRKNKIRFLVDGRTQLNCPCTRILLKDLKFVAILWYNK